MNAHKNMGVYTLVLLFLQNLTCSTNRPTIIIVSSTTADPRLTPVVDAFNNQICLVYIG